MKSLLVAPDFSDEFVNDCDLEFEINLSLITASCLTNILEGFRASKHKQFPYQLLMKDVLIKEDRILKAIKKEDGTYENLKVRLKVDDFRKWLHGKYDPFSEDEQQQDEDSQEEEEEYQEQNNADDSLPF